MTRDRDTVMCHMSLTIKCEKSHYNFYIYYFASIWSQFLKRNQFHPYIKFNFYKYFTMVFLS